jgi:peptidoglycan-N-acetylglucosamine deacetylase
VNRPVATISVDADPVDLHLAGYGITGITPDPLAYSVALPRLVNLFRRVGVRATFFVVGRDAQANPGPIAAVASAGHEIASHTFSHPFAFSRLATPAMRDELVASRNVLENSSGMTVTGFRAPNFDLDARGIVTLIEAGYRYDASAYPTPWLLPARLFMALKGGDIGRTLQLRCWPFTLEREPQRWVCDGRSLIEFPLTVSRGLRLPVYHTARYYLSDAQFHRTLDELAGEGLPLSYPLHAVDALGLAEDQVDSRLTAHPGMTRRLEDKLRLLESTLEAIASRFEIATFEERVLSLESSGEVRQRTLPAS